MQSVFVGWVATHPTQDCLRKTARKRCATYRARLYFRTMLLL